jgi:class 3 adenylate cyclase
VEPQIQYVTSADGVRIAYSATGNGPPFITMSPSLGNAIDYEWKIPAMRRTIEISSRALTYIRYDPRGCGLSDRNVTDFSLDAVVGDLAAVADIAAPAPFVLFAPGTMARAGITYAARNPERVSRLITWMGAANFDGNDVDPLEAVKALVATDYRLFTEAYYSALDGFTNPAVAAEMAAMWREAVTADTYLEFERQHTAWNMGDLYGRVQCPTLVVHPRQHPYFPVEQARRLAAAIPGARFALLDGSSVMLASREMLPLIAEFIGQPGGGSTGSGSTAVILFTDIADSTELTERIGDAPFRDRARTLDERLRRHISSAGGRAIDGKLLGDGVMAVFRSASDAVSAALRCREAGREAGLPLHVGLHAGDVLREGGDVYGGAVNIAARISALSAPGEVLVSATVRDLARTSSGVAFEDRGEHTLKGVADPVRIFAIKGATL